MNSPKTAFIPGTNLQNGAGTLSDWPKKPTTWIEQRMLYVSIPFTWNLPGVRGMLQQRSIFWDLAVAGGPAVELMPDYLAGMDWVTIGHDCPGVLQRINPMATRTTVGCVRRCGYCAIGTGAVEPGPLRCLDDWPDLPLICDNNLLAAPVEHFDRVVNRLLRHAGVDFNQGMDARLLTDYHAGRLAEIKGLRKRGIRLALDSMSNVDAWGAAYDRLRSAGLPKRAISTYALVGFDSAPAEAWARCKFIESHGARALPMWFHALDQLQKNIVTEDQMTLGWTDYERRKIMQWFYQHKKAAA